MARRDGTPAGRWTRSTSSAARCTSSRTAPGRSRRSSTCTNADASIAGKYLAATAQYIEMYRSLIGPYPYGKFALVENFWETGYGMPTFTLLGPQVIRFPFIINSSYPHEILHNWWGNSVFVDYGTGNWCEGLTAYLADHLIQEQRGAAAEYRRSTLQKYRDYVRTGRDFPLAEFRERYSAATEAVGYGKALMGYHALRLHIGDEAFRATFARFYREFKGRRATFRDIQRIGGGRQRQAARVDLRRPDHAGGRAGAGGEGWTGRRPPGRRALRRRRRAAPDPGGRAVSWPTSPSSSRPSAASRPRPCASTRPSRPSRSPTESRPLALSVDPVFRRVPAPRPAGDAAVNRPDLRGAGDPRRAALGRRRGGPRRVSRPAEGLAERRAPHHGGARPRREGPAGRPRRVDHRAHQPARRRTVRRAAGAARGRGGHRGRRREDAARGPHAGRHVPPPGERREGGRLDRRRAGGGDPRPRAQAPPLRQVLVSRASRATSRPTSSRASGSSPTRRCAWTCGPEAQRNGKLAALPADGTEGAGGAAAGLLAAGAARPRRVSRVARSQGTRPREPGPRQGRASTSPSGSRPTG